MEGSSREANRLAPASAFLSNKTMPCLLCTGRRIVLYADVKPQENLLPLLNLLVSFLESRYVNKSLELLHSIPQVNQTHYTTKMI